MQIGRLAALYDGVVRASRGGEAATAHEAFMRVLGLRARRTVTAVPRAAPPRSAPMLRFHVPRTVDVIALARGARQVAKFEDLDAGAAAALRARLQARGLRTVQAGPYGKRFDVAIADPGAGTSLFTVVASWGREAEAVVEAERDRTADGTRRAGLALGYPPCCVEHFAAIERGASAHEDGINEAAIRSPAGVRGVVPWEMNSLCVHSPLGFTPCSVTCPAALAFARRVLAAVRAEGPRAYDTVERALRRPILFFRFPLFHVLEPLPGAPPGGAVRYRGAVAAVEPGVAPALAAWHEDEVGVPLADADAVTLDDGALELSRGAEVVARWAEDGRGVPLLFRFGG